ncbi:unnamed protein product, partial [Staurois parvus]
MLSLVCIAKEVFFFFFLGECMGSAQGQSALLRQRSGVLHPPRAEIKLLLQALTSALLDTDRSHKTAVTFDEKMYLTVYIYLNNGISMFCVLWETRYSECRVFGRPDI